MEQTEKEILEILSKYQVYNTKADLINLSESLLGKDLAKDILEYAHHYHEMKEREKKAIKGVVCRHCGMTTSHPEYIT